MKRSYQQPIKRVNPNGTISWRAPVTDPVSGKRFWHSTHKTKKDASQAQDDYYRNLKVGLEDITLERYAERWLEEKPRPCDSTNRGNRQRLNAYIIPLLGEMAMADVRRKHVASLRDHYIKQGFSARSVRNILSPLSAMFSDAVEDEVAELNPCLNVRVTANDPRITAEPSREKVILTYGDMLRLAAGASPAYRGAVLFSGATGARPSEVLARRYDDLERDEGLVRIDTTADQGNILQGTKTDHGKPNPGRWSILTPELLEFIDAAPRSLSGLLFPTPRGRVWWLENFRNRVFQPAAVKAGFGTYKYPDASPGMRGYDGVVLYDLRHSFVSLMRAAGVDPADLAERTGHGVEVQTAVYTHALGRSDEAMRKVLSA